MCKPWETDYRIPKDTIPKHYELYLFPDLVQESFTGKVSITIQISEPRDFFVTHVKGLSVSNTQVFFLSETKKPIQIQEAFEYSQNEFWVVVLLAPIPPGLYELSMDFRGSLTNGIVGLYKSSYRNGNNEKISLASSKFEPTYARRAFPCFDEPSFRSTFGITLVKPSSYIALSNMPESSSSMDSPIKGFTSVTFQKSVPMVTYLVIFIVSDFESIQKETSLCKIPFKVYGTSSQIPHLNYALEIGAHITDYYTEYFKVPYPLPKLDMAAIPDYSSGATEHWGLITFRESNLIFDPVLSSSRNKLRVAEVIAHELVHQWFGNLMTISWWNDLWLNEGFATYLSYKGFGSFEKELDSESQFLIEKLHCVLDLDATQSTHPIVVNVDTPDEINAVFDDISYNKGAAILRMMENFLGPLTFQSGITNFLNKFSFKNAVTQDLFDEFSAVAPDLNITKIMNSWTRQCGYPVINVLQDKDSGRIQLTQERFSLDPSSSELFKPQVWDIPITYFIIEKDPVVSNIWFPSESQEIIIIISQDSNENEEKDRIIKFNFEQRGYYRVNYEESTWGIFAKNLQTLSISDRTGLLNDAFSLSAAHKLNYKFALDLTKYLSFETNIAPWTVAVTEFKKMESVFRDGSKLRAYYGTLVKSLYSSLGWEDVGDLNTKLLRPLILDLAIRASVGDSVFKVQTLLKDWKDNGSPLPLNLESLVLIQGMKINQDPSLWFWLRDVYSQESNSQRKMSLLRGLSSTSNTELLSSLIEWGKDVNNVREQDFLNLLVCISGNPFGEALVWKFFREEWTYLVKRFTLNSRYLGELISTLTSSFSTKFRLTELQDFIAKYPEAGAGENYRKIALERVTMNIKFITDHYDTIQNWLSNNTLN